MLEGEKELKSVDGISRPAFFSDAAAFRAAEKSLKTTNTKLKAMRARVLKALETPTSNDEVYKVCQRLFNKKDPLNLTRDNDEKVSIRRKALRRYLLGCPPRKKNDTSIGDAINWEWMVHCAIKHSAELVIVSRDSDYGVSIDKKSFINDHLRQEFSDRVSKKRKILLYPKLSDALKHFELTVDQAEIDAEEAILSHRDQSVLSGDDDNSRAAPPAD